MDFLQIFQDERFFKWTSATAVCAGLLLSILSFFLPIDAFFQLTENYAFCLLLLTGGGILSRLFEWGLVSLILSITGGLFAFVFCVENFFHLRLIDSDLLLSVNGATGIFLLNAGLLLSQEHLKAYPRLIQLGLFLSASSAAIACSAIVGYAIDLKSGYTWFHFPPMSFIFGIILFCYAGSLSLFIGTFEQTRTYFVPIAVTYFGIALSVLGAHNTLEDQRLLLQNHLHETAESLKITLSHAFQKHTDFLETFIEYYQNDVSENIWQVETKAYMMNLPGASCLQLFSKEGKLEKTSGECKNLAGFEEETTRFIQGVREVKEKMSISPIKGSAHDRYFLMLQRGPNGFLVSCVNLQMFLKALFDHTNVSHYLFVLFEGGQKKIVYNDQTRDERTDKLFSQAHLNVGGRIWQMDVFPLMEEYNIFITKLPRNVFIIGFLMALILGYALFLRQKSRYKSKQFERVNKALQDSESHLSDYSYELRRQIEALTLAKKELAAKSKSQEKLTDALKRLVEENQTAIALAEEEQQKAIRANAAKTRFLTHINHEIRTPLNSIVGFAEMMCDEVLGKIIPGEYKRYAQFIYEGGRHLASIVDDFLDFSLVDSKKIEAHPMLIDPQKLANACIALLRGQLEKKPVKLNVHIDENAPFLYVDPRHAKQIITNLLSNSVKFTDIYQDVFLIFRRGEEGGCEIIVQDTGMGIDPQHIEKIFEPFGEAHKACDGSLQSSGLGMYLIRSLTHLNKGEISVKSKPGVGTNVLLAFPEPPENAPIAEMILHKDAEKLRDQLKLPALNILAAEDNQTNQQFLKALLERNGHKVTFANNGKEAVECLKNDAYDVVLMDLQMPVLSGDDATRQIRILPSIAAKVPIIALTASTSAEDKEKIFASGMNGYLTKPVRHESLMSEIQRCLNI